MTAHGPAPTPGEDPAQPPTTWWAASVAGPWAGPLSDLEDHGVAVVAAHVSSWARQLPGGADLTRLLGSDRERYAQLPASLRPAFAATRLLIKQVAAVALCCAPSDIDLGYSFKGRAFVRGQDRAFLSLSHTRDVAVVALCHTGPVGVDVEHAHRDLQNPDITEMMTTPAELRALAGLDASRRPRALLRTWTLKEAYSKALGQGLLFPFTGFGFDVTAETGAAQLRRADDSVVRYPRWRLWSDTLQSPGVDGEFLLGLAVPRAGAHRPERQAAVHRSGVLHQFYADSGRNHEARPTSSPRGRAGDPTDAPPAPDDASTPRS